MDIEKMIYALIVAGVDPIVIAFLRYRAQDFAQFAAVYNVTIGDRS